MTFGKTACEIEESRQRKRALRKWRNNKRSRRGNIIKRGTRERELKRRSDRAKVLTNDGELSKAFSTMVQRGVASSTDAIVTQPGEKFPKREKTVRWLGKDRIDALRNLVEKIVIEMEVGDHKDEAEQSPINSGGRESESLRELKRLN